MSAMSRFGPAVGRSILAQQQRQMASAAAATDPIQKLFITKIREFKAANKGLDEKHQRALSDEMLRLKRVYQVDDASKLAHLEFKFANEHDVSLRDIEETKEKRAMIHSGEYQKQLAAATKSTSALLASIPEQVTLDLHTPPMNKPDLELLWANEGVPRPTQLSEPVPDYEFTVSKMTPDLLEKELLVKFGDNMPTINDEKAPERDTVNFPRIPPVETTPPTRFHIVPESWFQFFYPKTGVTGPYTFAIALSTFFLSKEWMVIEHEFYTLLSCLVIVPVALTKFGPQLREKLKNKCDEEIKGWDHWQKGNIETLNAMQAHCKNELTKTKLLDDLYEARKQDIEMQLECERRGRVKEVHDETKRRLNYLVDVANVTRHINQQNMVNWVISNVLSSLSQKSDNEIVDSCVVNLRQLASKNANTI